ncbi:MAG: zinc ribbon domain-containing protein [Deltaproteobacteria bacterium]|nr:zinc ribbon domain-containing protein [Deltaproteobacteria bacterium]
MPLFDYQCLDCGKLTEVLIVSLAERPRCEACGSHNLKRLMAAHSTRSGPNRDRLPGPNDHSCCGSTPGQSNCSGPGSCCGKH